ncbi:MAG: High-affinity nickel transporter [Bacteroidetes bacterium]|jgi:ABC-type nickel/cobalt efflux system permease component RcnA|nr:High-affinity nickel transporter [Bacteroidota bacterium]MBT6686219.1 High-affinity nickel transporter [Bacteroidota bacterium]MBT7144292.1 High-affinity nickel transporter [Bacteroidota bacterium]MBT7493511.1 High-affinity nickel transporter [Bacteroidota bacterium]
MYFSTIISIEIFATFFTGLLSSMVHVVSGPDHLAAVTPLAVDRQKRSWLVGFYWGIGHTLGILIIGILFYFFREILPVEKISAISEQLVGVILILIGTWAIVRTYYSKFNKSHSHPHIHTKPNTYVHVHDHSHEENQNHKHGHTKEGRNASLSSFLIGIFHGLAGVSHLLAILPTLALPSNYEAGSYLFGFGIGTIMAMVGFSMIIGYVAFKSSKKDKTFNFKALKTASGILAIAVGILWIINTF